MTTDQISISNMKRYSLRTSLSVFREAVMYDSCKCLADAIFCKYI